METQTKETWAALYKAAVAFHDTAPWQWMQDVDVFAVENPVDGEVGYCNVMGGGGEEFGLYTFLGAEGFAGYRRLMDGEVEPETFDARAVIRALTASFEDRQLLKKQDLAVVRSLGLRFRGRKEWPFFRSQSPGYVPWFLNEDEARFLTTALEQAVGVCLRVRDEGLDLLRGDEIGLILTRYYHDGGWLDEWRKPRRPERPTRSTGLTDELRARCLRLEPAKGDNSWELGCFLVPAAVQSGSERSYYPTCIMAVDGELGLIIGFQLLGPLPSVSEQQEAVVGILEQAREIPLEVRVATDEFAEIVEVITGVVGATLSVGPLPMLEEAREGFEGFL